MKLTIKQLENYRSNPEVNAIADALLRSQEVLREAEGKQHACPLCGLDAADFENLEMRHLPDCEYKAALLDEE